MSNDLAPDLVELAPYVPAAGEGAPLPEIAFRATAWHPDEDRILREMFAADASFDEIAARIQRGRFGIADRAWRLGLRRTSHNPWTELEDDFLAKHYGTEAGATIAQQLGRSCMSIYSRARMLGIAEEACPPWTPWEDAQLRAGYEQGIACAQIATLIGRSLIGLRTRAYHLGLRHPSQPGDWSEEETTRALELAEGGQPYSAIAMRLADEGFPRRNGRSFGQQLRKLGYGRGWGRPWMPEETDLLRHAYATSASLTPLIARLGRSRTSISWKAHDLGLQGTHARKDGWRNGPVWTEQEREFLRTHYATMKPAEVARHIGRGTKAIYYEAWRLGLSTGTRDRLSDDEKRAYSIAHAAGVAIPDLALALGRKAPAVHKYAEKQGMRFGRRPRIVPPPTLAQILAMESTGA